VMLRTDGAAEAAGRQPGWGLAASAYLLPLFTQVIHSPCRATPKPWKELPPRLFSHQCL